MRTRIRNFRTWITLIVIVLFTQSLFPVVHAVNIGTQVYMEKSMISFAKPPIIIHDTMYVDMKSLFRAFGLKLTKTNEKDQVKSGMPSPSPTPVVTPVASALASSLAEETATPEPTPFVPNVLATQGKDQIVFYLNVSGVTVNDVELSWDQPITKVNGVWYLPLRAFAEWQGMIVQRARFLDMVYLLPTVRRSLDQLLTTSDQWIYEGDIWNGKKQGLGKYYLNGALIYDGNFENDLMDGMGKLYLEGRLVYDGEFLANYPDGFGTFYESDGEIYQGYFAHGVKSGKGKLSLGPDVMYDGDWESDQMSGSGSLYDRGKALKYTGVMKFNRRNGFGTSFVGGKVEYRGDWKSGKRNGTGALFDINDSKVRYDGEWKDNVQDGFGTQVTYGKIPWVVLDAKGTTFAYRRDVVYWNQVQMRAGKLFNKDRRMFMYVGDTNENGYPNGNGTFYIQTGDAVRTSDQLTNYRKIIDGTFNNGRLFGEATIYDAKNRAVKQVFSGETIWTVGWE